ncbi:MAG: hypothetical protein PHN56_00550 [Candidatus Nanoarchaeia archaeon]|nr:hypothetical protein [Candidatus Nanoarchaeia archaeon]
MISANINSIQSNLLKSRTNLLKITNDIKAIEEMDLEWQINLTNQALQILNNINSSGTVNNKLGLFNASVYNYNGLLLLNYTKTYYYNEIVKTINGTIMVPYPYFEFFEIERELRECYNLGTALDICIADINDEPIVAELEGTVVYINNNDYVLSKELYPYIIII